MVPTEGAKSKLSIPIAGVDVFQSEISMSFRMILLKDVHSCQEVSGQPTPE
jgi:hypothetical protein